MSALTCSTDYRDAQGSVVARVQQYDSGAVMVRTAHVDYACDSVSEAELTALHVVEQCELRL